MQGNTVQGMRVAILVTDDFEQVELTEPKKALDQAGATTKIIAPKPGQVQGMNHDVKADTFPVDMTLDLEPKAQDFVRQVNNSGRPIAVICHGPWLLVSADLAKGRTLTSYYTIQDDIRNAGARWVDQELVRDGNWVSSRSPKDIPAFNKGMIELFSGSKVSSR